MLNDYSQARMSTNLFWYNFNAADFSELVKDVLSWFNVLRREWISWEACCGALPPPHLWVDQSISSSSGTFMIAGISLEAKQSNIASLSSFGASVANSCNSSILARRILSRTPDLILMTGVPRSCSSQVLPIRHIISRLFLVWQTWRSLFKGLDLLRKGIM